MSNISEKKKTRLIKEYNLRLAYWEDRDWDSANKLRIDNIKLLLTVFPLSTVAISIFLGIPLMLITKEPLYFAIIVGAIVSGIPSVGMLVFLIIFPAMRTDTAFYAGIIWFLLIHEFKNWTGPWESVVIPTFIMIIFFMWYNNIQRQSQIDEIKHKLEELDMK